MLGKYLWAWRKSQAYEIKRKQRRSEKKEKEGNLERKKENEEGISHVSMERNLLIDNVVIQ